VGSAQIVVAFVLALAWPSSPSAAEPGSYGGIDQEVRSVAMTDLRLVAQSAGEPWVVLKANPDRLSGAIVVGAGKQAVVSGSYTVVDQLGAPITRISGSYNWPAQRFWDDSAIFQLQREMPFRSRYHPDGDFVLCQYHENADAAQLFTDAASVPDEWFAQLKPAIAFLKSKPEPTGGALPAIFRAEWAPLMSSTNPYLAVTAVQALSERGALTTAEMGSVLSFKDKYAGGAGVCSAFLSGWFDSGPNSTFVLDRAKDIRSLDSLTAIAVGLSEARDMVRYPSHSGAPYMTYLNTDTYERVQQIMAVVRTKLTQLDPNGGSADLAWLTVDNACRMYRE